jgi:hypothetical protein
MNADKHRYSELAFKALVIARLTTERDEARRERDEARREAYRQWLMRQCDSEHEYGTQLAFRKLCAIYLTLFGKEHIGQMFQFDDPPPYDITPKTEETL